MNYERSRAFTSHVIRRATGLPWKDPRAEEGEILDPARRSMAECDARRRDLGEQGYSSQEQQRPAPATGALIKKSWIRYYDELPNVSEGYTVLSIDATFKGGPGSDYVAMEVWSKIGADMYLIDIVHERMGFSETLAAGEKLMRQWPTITEILVEDTANGPAIIDTWRQKFSGIIPVKPDGGKVARLNAVTYLFEAGNVYIPAYALAPWSAVFEAELTSFPLAPHDDLVDACSQALRRIGYARSNMLTGVIGITRDRGLLDRNRHIYEIPGVGAGGRFTADSVRDALSRT